MSEDIHMAMLDHACCWGVGADDVIEVRGKETGTTNQQINQPTDMMVHREVTLQTTKFCISVAEFGLYFTLGRQPLRILWCC